MIISASRRTDIPAFYSEWLRRRLEAGFCTVPNPFNARQVARVSLRAEDVEAIVFWTRHARPIFALLPVLERRGAPFYFQYTITGYGRPVEKRTPPSAVAVATFRDLAARLPRGAVVWRYDPILVGPAFPVAEHLARFSGLAAALEGATQRVVVSFVHIYRKSERRLGKLFAWGEELARDPTADSETEKLLAGLAEIAGAHGMALEACAQERDYEHVGVGRTRCVDDRILAALAPGSWPTRRDTGQRPHCRCIPSKDIGMVDTCAFGCAYCYATRSDATGRRRRREHDPDSPSLHGHHETGGAGATGC
jgi:hypothetical protein